MSASCSRRRPSPTRSASRSGAATARAPCCTSGGATHQRVRQLVQSLGIDCDYQQTGSLRLTRTHEESEDLRGSLPELRHDGFPMREIAIADAVPAHAVSGFDAAFEVPEDGMIHPVKFLHGIAVAALEKGARLLPALAPRLRELADRALGGAQRRSRRARAHAGAGDERVHAAAAAAPGAGDRAASRADAGDRAARRERHRRARRTRTGATSTGARRRTAGSSSAAGATRTSTPRPRTSTRQRRRSRPRSRRA